MLICKDQEFEVALVSGTPPKKRTQRLLVHTTLGSDPRLRCLDQSNLHQNKHGVWLWSCQTLYAVSRFRQTIWTVSGYESCVYAYPELGLQQENSRNIPMLQENLHAEFNIELNWIYFWNVILIFWIRPGSFFQVLSYAGRWRISIAFLLSSISDRYVSVRVAPPGRLGVCRLLYTVRSNIAFLLFESNAYPGLRLQPAQRIQGCSREKRALVLNL